MAPLTSTLLDAVLRLVRLLQYAAEIPLFVPMIEREILLRLLLDKNGSMLHHANTESHCRRTPSRSHG